MSRAGDAAQARSLLSGLGARIGPQEVPIRKAKGMFQPITLPGGQSRLRFFYRPILFRPAIGAASIALLLWLFLLFAGLRATRLAKRDL